MQTYSFCYSKALVLRIFWILVILFSVNTSGKAQDSARFAASIRKLSSKAMAGRGYLFRGHRKAARYIELRFRRAGLRPAGRSFLQEFQITQNLFPSRPKLKLNGRKLRPGRDFIPAPASPSASGSFRLDSSQGSLNKNVALLLKDKEAFKPNGSLNPGLIVRRQSKLTHSLSENQSQIPEILLHESAIQKGDSILKIRLRPSLRDLNAYNVMGMVRGTAEPDSFLVLCAHYDHLGSLGRNTYFPGANDNASGVAMLLELARAIAKRPLRYSVLFVAFSGEEAGLLGSSFMSENPPIPLSKIRFLFNLDLLGFGEKGATVVNATVHPKEFERLQEINASCHCLPEIKARGKAANSDHYPFSEKGVPAFFMYLMGGPGFYHDIDDKPKTLSLKGFRGTFRLIMEFMRGF